MRLYLDNCCLNRPFDDPAQARILLEAQAVVSIIQCCETGTWELVSSTTLQFEAAQTQVGPRKMFLAGTLALAVECVALNDTIAARAQDLEHRGFQSIDALHLASAEEVGADCFCTCDDKLLRLAARQQDLKTRVLSPVEAIQEFSQ